MATDYTTSCGSDHLSWIQMLASTIVGYHDISGALHYRINSLQYSDNCSELSAFADCDTSHLDPERQLVENVFALDDCGTFLALELFSNGDNDWTDYSECGEVPLSFVQMLARCIYTYSGGNKLNAVIDTGACTSATQLLSCTVNDIESERLLVAILAPSITPGFPASTNEASMSGSVPTIRRLTNPAPVSLGIILF